MTSLWGLLLLLWMKVDLGDSDLLFHMEQFMVDYVYFQEQLSDGLVFPLNFEVTPSLVTLSTKITFPPSTFFEFVVNCIV